jgi:hypothetical protein
VPCRSSLSAVRPELERAHAPIVSLGAHGWGTATTTTSTGTTSTGTTSTGTVRGTVSIRLRAAREPESVEGREVGLQVIEPVPIRRVLSPRPLCRRGQTGNRKLGVGLRLIVHAVHAHNGLEERVEDWIRRWVNGHLQIGEGEERA